MSTNRPAVSVIIPWAHRPELATSLRDNDKWFSASNSEVVVVNVGGDLKQIPDCINGHYSYLRCIDIPAKHFNKCLALNIGAYFARSENLFILDCDLILQSDFIAQSMLLAQHKAFVTIRFMSQSIPDSPSLIATTLSRDRGLIKSVRQIGIIEVEFTDGSRTQIKTSKRELLDGRRAAYGPLFLRKEDFVEVGGYHSGICTWGWEDDDISFRLQKLLRLDHIEMGEAVHITHDDKQRSLFGESKTKSDDANMAQCLTRYSAGDFLGTYYEDVSDWVALCQTITFI